MLTLDLARRLLEAAEAEAARQNLMLAFAIVDAGGHLVASARMDGAGWITPRSPSARPGPPRPTVRRAPRRATRPWT